MSSPPSVNYRKFPIFPFDTFTKKSITLIMTYNIQSRYIYKIVLYFGQIKERNKKKNEKNTHTPYTDHVNIIIYAFYLCSTRSHDISSLRAIDSIRPVLCTRLGAPNFGPRPATSRRPRRTRAHFHKVKMILCTWDNDTSVSICFLKTGVYWVYIPSSYATLLNFTYNNIG